MPNLSKYVGQLEHTGESFVSPVIEDLIAKNAARAEESGMGQKLLNESPRDVTPIPEALPPGSSEPIPIALNSGEPTPIKPEMPQQVPENYDPLAGSSFENIPQDQKQGFLSRNKGKIATGVGLGAIGYNLMNGPGSTENQLKTPMVKPKQSEEPEEISRGDEVNPEDKKTTESGDRTSIPTDNTQQRGLQGITDLLSPQTQDYQAGLQDAQQRRNQSILAAQLGKAGVQLGASIARVAPEKTDILDTAIKQADNIVKDYDDKIAMEKKDPNSDYSKGLQKYLKNMYGVDTNASAEAIAGTMLKPLETMYENQQKAKNHKEEMALKYKELAHQKEGLALQKAQHEQDATNFKVQSQLESARGQKATQQAEFDLYNIKKINTLANLYGDPNKLDPQQMQLLRTEAAKVATGGVPSIHELRGLKVDTLPSWIAEKAQLLTNAPSEAHAGEFAKSLQDYANQIGTDAKTIINDKYVRSIESNKKQLGDNNYQALKAQYLGRFPELNENKQQDPQIAKWAKEHKLDYDKAKVIIDARKQGQ